LKETNNLCRRNLEKLVALKQMTIRAHIGVSTYLWIFFNLLVLIDGHNTSKSGWLVGLPPSPVEPCNHEIGVGITEEIATGNYLPVQTLLIETSISWAWLFYNAL
jgi:hypothetical protein